MIIVVGGIKGGSGKTTTAVNLAIMRAARWTASTAEYKREISDVLLVDADDQETSSDFTQLRSEKIGEAGYTSIKLSGAAVRTQILRLREKYDDILIDTGGRDTTSQRAALTIADLLLVPFVPRSFDIWTLQKISTLVDEMRPANLELRAATFLNRADPRGADNSEAAELLRESGSLEYSGVALGTRKAFANAAAAGLAVPELKPTDPKAVEEIEALYRWVFGEISTRNQSDITQDQEMRLMAERGAEGVSDGNYPAA